MRPETLNTFASYSRKTFLADLFAGVTVAMVALPLSLAIAIASGAGPDKGLVTAIVAGFLISALGGSKVQIGGPTGAFIVVVYGVIAAHGYDGLVTATLMAGIILAVAGYLRIGNLVAYVPEPVINGFTIGIALIIATSQLKDLLGLQTGAVPADFLPKIEVLWAARSSLNGPALGIGLLTMLLIIVFRKAAPRLPGLIVAVALTSAFAVWAGSVDTITSRFGDLPRTLPLPHLPDLSVGKLRELLPSAFTIAFLAGIESLLSAMVADRMIGAKHRPNAEVAAQGFANIASSLFGGLPATGAIARTATNVRAGGQTPVAGMIHAVTIMVVMFVAAPLAGRMAMPALAGLLILTAWNMSEPGKWRHYMAAPMADRLLLLLTLTLTVLADLTTAIGVGTALGLALRLRRNKVPPASWDTPDR